MELIQEVYDSWGAEVVFITSNFDGNREMMEGCKEAGIPAFVGHFHLQFRLALTLFIEGTLWDF
jgi:hypothetical protein